MFQNENRSLSFLPTRLTKIQPPGENPGLPAKKRRDGSSSLEGLNGSTSSVTNLSENPRCFKFILALYDPISPKSKRKAGFMISMTTLPQMNQITRLEPTNLANVCKCGFS